MHFSDLPSDLDDQLPASLPPPAWFPVTGVLTTTVDPRIWYSPQFYGLGDREEEVEVNPVEVLEELKLKQEMPEKIPLIANRYTKIEPLSPMFRANRPKYGYGDFTPTDTKNLIKLIIGFGLVWYFLLRKK